MLGQTAARTDTTIDGVTSVFIAIESVLHTTSDVKTDVNLIDEKHWQLLRVMRQMDTGGWW